MKSFALMIAAAAGLMVAPQKEAEAQWSIGFHGGYSQPYYGHYHHYVNPGWGGGYAGHYDWHDTTHYDYQPPTYYRHRNHYHYNPGGYYLHRDGHWDYHH
jgi:hypothetical protein